MPNIYVMKKWLNLYTRSWANSGARHFNFANYEQQVQGEGQHLAMEYKKFVEELNEKARENLRFRTESSKSQSAIVIMKERIDMLKEEECAAQEEANGRVLAMESGARALQSRLSKEDDDGGTERLIAELVEG
ncbi:hypothetical protein AK812_SmicGene25724 [Symbiodinium microadriaticum]|uniref:Uncharacterized protein n=1 Tax=Symbiodinium microadriaticum TaxID=2951 RepID=A0A1Q9DB98_SYMMI|nr:hypothetical protein AK812_SmicGene25724 [Symbiodinium microadriaticum]